MTTQNEAINFTNLPIDDFKSGLNFVHSSKPLKRFKHKWGWKPEGSKRWKSDTSLFYYDIVDVYERKFPWRKVLVRQEIHYRYFVGHCVSWIEYKYTENKKACKLWSILSTDDELYLCDEEKAFYHRHYNEDDPVPLAFKSKHQAVIDALLVDNLELAKQELEEIMIAKALRGE